ncbi:hypothetical protein HDV05_004326 [Chytridiales sp. JEL 0842]|nr:hypothetical protein HDV05_004326 [Chytridiales sp. JEL 0842]
MHTTSQQATQWNYQRNHRDHSKKRGGGGGGGLALLTDDRLLETPPPPPPGTASPEGYILPGGKSVLNVHLPSVSVLDPPVTLWKLLNELADEEFLIPPDAFGRRRPLEEKSGMSGLGIPGDEAIGRDGGAGGALEEGGGGGIRDEEGEEVVVLARGLSGSVGGLTGGLFGGDVDWLKFVDDLGLMGMGGGGICAREGGGGGPDAAAVGAAVGTRGGAGGGGALEEEPGNLPGI